MRDHTLPARVRRWVGELIRAVDDDNRHQDRTCAASATRRVLAAAPPEARYHASLSLADFDRAADRPLGALRSDTVAHEFTADVSGGGLNVLVGRMTVPGGPWPGHFGLEALAFRATSGAMPPAFGTGNAEFSLDFGALVAASRGYRDGSGAVLFPEQLSVDERPHHQAFGVVFLDRLHALFVSKVLPLLADGTFDPTEVDRMFDLRRLAFLAHERGHLATSDPEAVVVARRRRLVGVVSELHADLEALDVLATSGEPHSPAAAIVLVADRIAREAWLRRPYAQVDAIAARQLLGLLSEAGGVLVDGRRLRIEIDKAMPRLREELDRVRALERLCCQEGQEPAREYLRRSGWKVVDTNCYRELDTSVARFLAAAVAGRRGDRDLPPGRTGVT